MLQKKSQRSAFLAGISVLAMAGTAFAADRFGSWAEMEATGCYEEGPDGDYEIVVDPNTEGRRREFHRNLVMAIHGGIVEVWTDELAAAVAYENPKFTGRGGLTHQANLYMLVTHVDESETCNPANGGPSFLKDNKDLHITAVNFDEPQAEAMVAEAFTIVTIHGMADNKYTGGGNMAVCVGGQNAEMRNNFINAVNNDPLLSSFMDAVDATLANSGCPEELDGTHDLNIVNRGPNPNGGLQLELTKSLREALFVSSNENKRKQLVKIIQNVMYEESKQAPLL